MYSFRTERLDGRIDEIHRERTGGNAVGIGDTDGSNQRTGEFEDGLKDLQAFIGIGDGEFVEEKEGVDGIDASEEEELGEAIRGVGLLGVVFLFNGGIIDDARACAGFGVLLFEGLDHELREGGPFWWEWRRRRGLI